MEWLLKMSLVVLWQITRRENAFFTTQLLQLWKMELYWFSILGLTTSYIFLIGLGISIFKISIIFGIVTIYIKHTHLSKSDQIKDESVRPAAHNAFIQYNNFESLRRLQPLPADEEMFDVWMEDFHQSQLIVFANY